MNATFLLLTTAWLAGADTVPVAASAAPLPTTAPAPLPMAAPGAPVTVVSPAPCDGPSCGACNTCCGYYCKPTLKDRFDAFRHACGTSNCGCDGCTPCYCKPTLKDRFDAFRHASGSCPSGPCTSCPSGGCGH